MDNNTALDQEAKPLAPGKLTPKRMCQVPGCTADLQAIGKPYCCMKCICPVHMKADVIPIYNQLTRYCQQCGTLEPLAMFESNKRSCRDRLERRVKRPAQPEQKRERRKRRTAGSFGPSSSNKATNGSWRFTAAAADAAAATATGLSDAMLEVNPTWDASLMGGASVLQGSGIWEAAAATEAASWGSHWLELPAGAAAAAAMPAAAAAAPARKSGVAAVSSVMTADFNAPAATAAAAPAAALTSCGVPWQQQPVQLQPLCMQNLGAAAAGMNSPLSTSCSSSDSMDPAVLELEQFMLLELAAAGILPMDSSSAARLPEPPVAVAEPAPAQPQMNWQAARIPHHQQQQQAPAMVPAVLQHQCSGVYTGTHQQWHSLVAAPTAAGKHHATAMCTAAPAAVRHAAPVGVAGMMPPLQVAPVKPAGCGAAASAAAAPASSNAGQRGRNAHVMAQLQDRLYALQSQMEDMQLILGLLQNA